MKLKRMIAGFTAFATAVSTAIVMPVTASAADPFVALGGVAGCESVVINYDLDISEAGAADGAAQWTMAEINFNTWNSTIVEGGKGEYFSVGFGGSGQATYFPRGYAAYDGAAIDDGELVVNLEIDPTNNFALTLTEHANWDLTINSVTCYSEADGEGDVLYTWPPVIEEGLATEPYEYTYDGSPFEMLVEADKGLESGLKATYNMNLYPEGYSMGMSFLDVKKLCSGLRINDFEITNVPDGIVKEDLYISTVIQYNADWSGWAPTGGTSVDFANFTSISDDTPIQALIFQVYYALPVGTAYEAGDKIVINGEEEPELQQFWLQVNDHNYGVVSLYDSEGTLLETETDPSGYYNYHLTEKDEIRAVFESDEWEVEDVQLIAGGDTIETFTTSEFTFAMPSADAVLDYNCKVIDVPVEAIYIEEDSMTVNVGDEVAIDYYVEEEDHNDTIVWTSSNDTVVTVDDEGVITALKPGTATVTASATKCDATDSIVITVKAPLPAIKTAVAGDGQVTLTWNAIEGATKYAVYLYDGEYTCVDSNVTGTSYTVEDLTNGTKYGFKIKAYTGGWSEASAMVYATPLGNIVPQNVKAAAGDGEATITWDAVAGAQRYAVYTHDGESWVCLNSKIETNSYTVEELTNGTKYSFKVKTYAGGKWSAASAAASVVPNNGNYVPANVKAAAADSAVTVTWDEVEGAERYAVYIYENGAYTCLNSKINTNSYTVEELTNGTKYGFKVKACMNGKWSAASKMAYCVPNDGNYVPANVKTTAGDGEATITWDAVAGAERYAVYIYENGEYTCLDSRINTNSYTAEGLTNDTKYGFKVKACMNGKWSAASRIAYATPFTIIPQNVSATYDGDKFAVASWDEVEGAEQYEVFLYPSGSNTSTSLGYANSSTISFIMPPLGSPVGIAVKAYVNGVWSAESEIFYLYL